MQDGLFFYGLFLGESERGGIPISERAIPNHAAAPHYHRTDPYVAEVMEPGAAPFMLIAWLIRSDG